MRISLLKPLRMAGVLAAALLLSAVLHGATPGISYAETFPSAALSTVFDIDDDITTGDAAGKDNPWDFGTKTQYPVLRSSGHNIDRQRRS